MKLIALLALLLFAAWPTHAQGLQTVFLDWHPSGQWLAVSDFDSVKIIEVSSGQTVNEYPHTSGDPFRPGGPLEWSPDGMSLAFTDYQPMYVWSQPWNPSQAQLEMRYDYNSGLSQPSFLPTSNIKWSPDGERLIVHSRDVFDVVDANTGSLQYVNSGDFVVNDVAWMSNERIVVATREGFIVTMDASTGEPQTYLINYVQADLPNYLEVSLDPANRQAVIGSSDGEIIVWNNMTSAAPDYQNEVTQWQVGSGSVYAVNDVDWSPSGQYVAVSFGNGEVAVYDAVSGEQLVTLSLGGETANNVLAWSPDGSQLAYGLPDGGYALFDASTLPGYVPMETAEVSS